MALYKYVYYNSQYRRQRYIKYHGYKYSLPSVAGFIRQSGDYYLFLSPEIFGGQGSERVNTNDATFVVVSRTLKQLGELECDSHHKRAYNAEHV